LQVGQQLAKLVNWEGSIKAARVSTDETADSLSRTSSPYPAGAKSRWRHNVFTRFDARLFRAYMFPRPLM